MGWIGGHEPVVIGQGEEKVSGLAVLQGAAFFLIKLNGPHHVVDLIQQHPAFPIHNLPCCILLHLPSLLAQLQLQLEQTDLRTCTCCHAVPLTCILLARVWSQSSLYL